MFEQLKREVMMTIANSIMQYGDTMRGANHGVSQVTYEGEGLTPTVRFYAKDGPMSASGPRLFEISIKEVKTT